MVSGVAPSAMSAMARISMGIQEHNSDFGIASLNVANGFANQENPYGFSRLTPNNPNGPAFTDMSSMGGLSGTSAISSSMVNAIQDVNFDTPHSDNSFSDAIDALVRPDGSSNPSASDGISTAAVVSALVALAGATGAVAASPTAIASVSEIGDTSTIGEVSTEASENKAAPEFTEQSVTTSGGSGSGEALAGLGGASALSGDAPQAIPENIVGAEVANFVSNDATRAESGVGIAKTTQSFRKMEAYTKLQDDVEITHDKVLAQILMNV